MTAPTLEQLEEAACNPSPVCLENFNHHAVIPYNVTVEHICAAMNEFVDFIRMMNQRLHENGTPRFETMLMAANFSSVVGEFITANLPKHSAGIVKNRYHNGHPDMLPAECYPRNAIQYCHDGIEVKASRYLKAWQGHNVENIWLMVFMFDGNRSVDEANGVAPMPFRFLRVVRCST